MPELGVLFYRGPSLLTRVGAAKKWALVPIANVQAQKSTSVPPPATVIQEADVAPERRSRPDLRQKTQKTEVAGGASWWLTAGRDHFTMAAEGQLSRMRLSKESQRGRYRAIEDE